MRHTEDKLICLWTLAGPITLVGTHPPITRAMAAAARPNPGHRARGFNPGDTRFDNKHCYLHVPESLGASHKEFGRSSAVTYSAACLHTTDRSIAQ